MAGPAPAPASPQEAPSSDPPAHLAGAKDAASQETQAPAAPQKATPPKKRRTKRQRKVPPEPAASPQTPEPSGFHKLSSLAQAFGIESPGALRSRLRREAEKASRHGFDVRWRKPNPDRRKGEGAYMYDAQAEPVRRHVEEMRSPKPARPRGPTRQKAKGTRKKN